jgi:hypothetical protein
MAALVYALARLGKSLLARSFGDSILQQQFDFRRGTLSFVNKENKEIEYRLP